MSAQKGFTLFEVMVVLSIVAMLAVLTIPSFQQPLDRVARTQAGACLMQLATALERYRTETGAYQGFVIDGNETACVAEQAERFVFGFLDEPDHGLSPMAPDTPYWTLRADAVGQGSMDDRAESACAALSYESTGRRGAVGADGLVLEDAEAIRRCWH